MPSSSSTPRDPQISHRSSGFRSIFADAALQPLQAAQRQITEDRHNQQQVVVAAKDGGVAQPAFPGCWGGKDESQLAALTAAAYARAMRDATEIFLQNQGAAAAPANPIIIHNTASSETLAAASSAAAAQQTACPKPAGKPLLDLVQQFWSSRLNRLLVCGVTAFAAWLIVDIRRARRRSELLRRRLELSPLLRMSQWLSKNLSESHGPHAW